MARNIKIELELPEFEKELVVSVTLKRDGEVTSVTSSPASGVSATVTGADTGLGWKQSPAEEPPKKGRSKKETGNMMDMSF